MSESENTSNRVYVKSAEFGWLPAKIANTPADGPGKVKISIKKYVDDEQIPSCEVTTSQKKRSKRDKKIQTIEIDINLDDYTDKVIPLQNVDEDGKLKEVEDMVDLSFLHEVSTLSWRFASLGRCVNTPVSFHTLHIPTVIILNYVVIGDIVGMDNDVSIDIGIGIDFDIGMGELSVLIGDSILRLMTT